MQEYHIGFIGFGHMAQVIFKAIDRAKIVPRSQIRFLRRDPAKMKECEQEFGITATSMENLVRESHLLLLCVRPNQADFILQDMARLGVKDKMVVSVLAGVKIAFYQKFLGSHAQILRVMPNIASAVGEGMSVFSYGPNPTLEFRSLTNLVFSSMGEVIEVAENLMDISCGIAGSGPGFVFRLIEAAARIGEKQGLTYAKALKMAAQTFAGAGKLILKGALPEQLIHQIATPNGTTEAGFKSMSATQIEKQLQAAIEASARRSKEISEEIY
jgi:pyrroline-5-carboxylate reductase